MSIRPVRSCRQGRIISTSPIGRGPGSSIANRINEGRGGCFPPLPSSLIQGLRLDHGPYASAPMTVFSSRTGLVAAAQAESVSATSTASSRLIKRFMAMSPFRAGTFFTHQNYSTRRQILSSIPRSGFLVCACCAFIEPPGLRGPLGPCRIEMGRFPLDSACTMG